MACPAATPPVRLCACGRPAAGKYGFYCIPCGTARRRKPAIYVPTPEIDRQILEAYGRNRKYGNRTAITTAARKIGWPTWKVHRRAIALGIARTKEAPWSADELAILSRYGWMCDGKLSDKLKDAGFHRTATAVHLKKKRMHILRNGDWYSATQLSEAFGEDSHKIIRWIRAGLLRGVRRGTDRTEHQGGDTHLILHRDVREFALVHPDEYELAKVEKRWFLELVTGRNLAADEDAAAEVTLP